jgi:hypothetical protein
MCFSLQRRGSSHFSNFDGRREDESCAITLIVLNSKSKVLAGPTAPVSTLTEQVERRQSARNEGDHQPQLNFQESAGGEDERR